MHWSMWRRIWAWALLGTVIALTIALTNLASTHDQLGGLLTTGPTMPPAALLRQELPDEPLLSAGQHDGPYYYAIARDPLHLDQATPYLDRPRYRLQRIFFPLVVWLFHPTGGGSGLVWTMFVVNAVGILLGGLATGRLSTAMGGPTWPAALFGALFGASVCLRISTPDTLALALALLAIMLSLRERNGWAVAVGVLAVLTRESTLLCLLGFALWRRDRAGLAIAAIPAAVAAAWWLWLLARIGGPTTNDEIVLPFLGWRDSFRYWIDFTEPLGVLSFLSGMVVAGVALVKAPRTHPLYWAIVANLALTPFLSINVLVPERSTSRVFLTFQVLGALALVTARTAPATPSPTSLTAATNVRPQPVAEIHPRGDDRA